MGNLQLFDIKKFVNRGNGHAGTQDPDHTQGTRDVPAADGNRRTD